MLIFQVTAQPKAPRLGTVKGKIFTEKGEEVPFATLRIEPTDKAGMAAEDGFFEIKDIPFGQYQLYISSLVIQATHFNITVNKPYQELNYTVNSHAGIDLHEVKTLGKPEKKEIETQGF